MWIINLMMGFSLGLLGMLIKKYSLSGLIAGYNTASQKKRDEYDEGALVKYVGNFIIILSLPLLIGGLLQWGFPSWGWLIPASWGAFAAITAAGLIFLNTTRKVKK